MTLDTSLPDPASAWAIPPQWLADYLSADLHRGGQRHFLTRSVGIRTQGARRLAPPEGRIGPLRFRAAPSHHFCNLAVLDREVMALAELETLGPTLNEIRTTREFRLLLAASMPLFEELATRFEFITCVDALCDRVSERLSRPCLIEAFGPLDDSAANPDRTDPSLVLLRVFP